MSHSGVVKRRQDAFRNFPRGLPHRDREDEKSHRHQSNSDLGAPTPSLLPSSREENKNELGREGRVNLACGLLTYYYKREISFFFAGN